MRRHYFVSPGLLACLVLLFCLPLQADIAPEAASERHQPKTAESSQWMVVTANHHASQAASSMLDKGGSAVDAAIAAQLVLGLVEPQSSGIGGGGFLLHWQAKEKQLQFFDGRETAPAALKSDHFLQNDQPMPFWDAVVGGHAVGVPGLVAMLQAAHEQHGMLSWTALFEPAIHLAEEGFALSPRLHSLLLHTASNERTMQQQAFVAHYFADGKPLPPGSLLKNPAYAKTLKLLAEKGAQAFYQGELAEQIVAAVQNNPLAPGLLSKADMAGYQVKERKALCKQIKPYQLCGAGMPSSGPLAVMQIVSILDKLPGQAALSWDSPDFYHRFVEALKLAMADRDYYLADADFENVPVKTLLDEAYLEKRAGAISLEKAGGKAQPGRIEGFATGSVMQTIELPSTTHLSIVDGHGNIVSMTTSVEMAFGSRIMLGGFLLNNQLTDFSFRDTENGQKTVNRALPGKRPRSSMAPMLMFDQHQQPLLVIGSPGGPRIIAYVAKTMAQHLYHGATLAEAIDSAHISYFRETVGLEKHPHSKALQNELEKRGHALRLLDQTSGIHAIAIDDGLYLGVADGRREGVAEGGSKPRN